MTCVSLASVVMFLAPWLASCLPLTASSCWLIVISKPGTLICDSASATPFAVGTPFGASPPVMGSSIPTLMAVAGPPAAALPAGALDEPVVVGGPRAGGSAGGSVGGAGRGGRRAGRGVATPGGEDGRGSQCRAHTRELHVLLLQIAHVPRGRPSEGGRRPGAPGGRG